MKMNTKLLGAALLFVAGVVLAAPSAQGRFDGIWEGNGEQSRSRWTIRIAIVDGQYLIDYPSLRCGGRMKLVSEDEDKIVFDEELDFGLGTCINHGRTVLTKRAEHQADYQWYDQRGKLIAVGAVSRSVERRNPGSGK